MVTVITRTRFPKHYWEVMESLTERSIPIFRSQEGFISMEVFKMLDQSGTCTVFKWESLADHENCMNSPAWADLNTEWDQFLDKEEVIFEFVGMGEHWK